MGVGDSEGDLAVEDVLEELAANFGAPALGQTGGLTVTFAIHMPADQAAEIGAGADQLHGNAFLQAQVGQSDAQELPQDLFFFFAFGFFDWGKFAGWQIETTLDGGSNLQGHSAVV